MAFAPGDTAFGIYDSDPAFVTDADRLVRYCAVKLGGGLMGTNADTSNTHVQVEVTSKDVYTSFEDATVEYSAIVNSFQARSALAAFLGSATGSLSGERTAIRTPPWSGPVAGTSRSVRRPTSAATGPSTRARSSSSRASRTTTSRSCCRPRAPTGTRPGSSPG